MAFWGGGKGKTGPAASCFVQKRRGGTGNLDFRGGEKRNGNVLDFFLHLLGERGGEKDLHRLPRGKERRKRKCNGLSLKRTRKGNGRRVL